MSSTMSTLPADPRFRSDMSCFSSVEVEVVRVVNLADYDLNWPEADSNIDFRSIAIGTRDNDIAIVIGRLPHTYRTTRTQFRETE